MDGLSENAFRTVLEIDLMGTFNTFKATIEHVKKSRGCYVHVSATLHYTDEYCPEASGTIEKTDSRSCRVFHVFLGRPQLAPQKPVSMLSTRASQSNTGKLCFAHSSVDQNSRLFPLLHSPFAVRSNVIAPGLIAGTEGASRLTPKGADEFLSAKIPLQRPGEKMEIGSTCVFLCSEAASYISGYAFVVDGAAWHGQGFCECGLIEDLCEYSLISLYIYNFRAALPRLATRPQGDQGPHQRKQAVIHLSVFRH